MGTFRFFSVGVEHATRAAASRVPIFQPSCTPRTGLIHSVSKFFDRQPLLLFRCPCGQSRSLRFFVQASESTLDNRARSNHGTERRFCFLGDSHQLFRLRRFVHLRGHICDGGCECHAAVPHTLASKSLLYQNWLLGKHLFKS